MTKHTKANRASRQNEPIPPGATKKASDRQLPSETPSDLGDPHAAGTAAGGTEVGGLGGTNVGHGDPENADLERAFGSPRGDDEEDAEEAPAGYAGPSGGAVGGTPAGKRSVGGKTDHGLTPGASHRGDSTLGANPDRPTD